MEKTRKSNEKHKEKPYKKQEKKNNVEKQQKHNENTKEILIVYPAGKFNYDNNLLKNFFKLLLATSFIYILGMIWLGNLIGWDKPIFKLGAQPFLLAELLKILIATFALSQIRKIKKII